MLKPGLEDYGFGRLGLMSSQVGSNPNQGSEFKSQFELHSFVTENNVACTIINIPSALVRSLAEIKGTIRPDSDEGPIHTQGQGNQQATMRNLQTPNSERALQSIGLKEWGEELMLLELVKCLSHERETACMQL